jgi:hypothetical protein
MSISKDTMAEAAAPARKTDDAAPVRSINEILRDLADAHAATAPMAPTARLWLELRDSIDTKKK